MSELKKISAKNTVIFLGFILSLVFMGIITIGVSLGYIQFGAQLPQGSSTATSLGTPSQNCATSSDCFENSPLDKRAVEQ